MSRDLYPQPTAPCHPSPPSRQAPPSLWCPLEVTISSMYESVLPSWQVARPFGPLTRPLCVQTSLDSYSDGKPSLDLPGGMPALGGGRRPSRPRSTEEETEEHPHPWLVLGDPC